MSLDDVVGVDRVLHEGGARDDLGYALPLTHCLGELLREIGVGPLHLLALALVILLLVVGLLDLAKDAVAVICLQLLYADVPAFAVRQHELLDRPHPLGFPLDALDSRAGGHLRETRMPAGLRIR